MVAPVIVTAVFAKARPTKLDDAPVKLMAEPARTFPWKAVPSPIVAAVPVSQNTLHGRPPPAITTLVVAVVMPVPIWKIRMPFLAARTMSTRVSAEIRNRSRRSF